MKKFTTLTLALMMTAGVAVAADNFDGRPPMGAEPHGKHEFKHDQDGKNKKDGKHERLPRGFEELNLSSEQKAKIQAIVEANRPNPNNLQAKKPQNNNNLKQKLQAIRDKENQLLNGKKFDENMARQLIAERQQERLELEKQHADFEMQTLKKRHEIFQVLTPAQQKQYHDNQNKRIAEFDKRHEELMQKRAQNQTN